MNIVSLYAELQTNSRSQSAYKKISEYYRNQNRINEAIAFEELIEAKFHDRTHTDKEQREDNSEDNGIDTAL